MSERNTGGGFSPRSLARASLARIGSGRAATPGALDPLLQIVRQSHPKADLSVIERAYDVAERAHRDQVRKSGDPYITHPLAVATIPVIGLGALGLVPFVLSLAGIALTVRQALTALGLALVLLVVSASAWGRPRT